MPDTSTVIKSRHCKRAFLKRTISKETLRSVLSTAGHAASSKNTQPWQVAVVQGDTLDRLRAALCAQFDSGAPATPDYQYSMSPLPDAWMNRARECGYGLFELKGIARDDRDARLAHSRENFVFFNAPVALIFYMTANVERGNFLDMGLFLQNVMLGLTDNGLGSCPQFSVAGYPDTIRNILDLPSDCVIVCGMAVGYPDPNNPINDYVPKRLDANDYVKWLD